MEMPYTGGFTGARTSGSQLTQTRVDPADSEDTERGRRFNRGHHSITDGGCDSPPIPTDTDNTQKKLNLSDAKKLIESHLEPTQTSNETLEPENDPKKPQLEPKLQGEQTEPLPTDCTNEPSHAVIREVHQVEATSQAEDHGTEHGESVCGEAGNLALETRSLESNATSDEVPGTKTPETDDEPCQNTTASPELRECSDSAQTEAESQFSTSTVVPEATAAPSKRDKGKTPAIPEVIDRPGLSRAVKTTPTGSLPRRSKPKKLKKKYQPKTDTGKSIEQYTREVYADRLAQDPDFKFSDEGYLEDAIGELQDEWRQKGRKAAGLDPHDESADDADESTN